MQSILVNKKITKDKILSISFLSEKENINEFIIYADNILEGITLLNDLTIDDDYLKFYGVIYTVPEKNPEFYVSRDKETIEMAINLGHFSNIAHHESFVVIIVYLNEKGQTGFKLVYSPKFDTNIRERLDKEFNQ